MRRIILYLLLFILLIPLSANAAKGFFIVKMQGGSPMLGELTYKGYVFVGNKGNWGAYIISGTAAQLTAIDALPDCIGIATKSMLSDTVRPTVRTKLNTWLSNNRYSQTISTSTTNKEVIKGIFKLFHANYKDIDGNNDVIGLPIDEVQP